MFGNKKSTDECYKNERTFECYNICSCPKMSILSVCTCLMLARGTKGVIKTMLKFNKQSQSCNFYRLERFVS